MEPSKSTVLSKRKVREDWPSTSGKRQHRENEPIAPTPDNTESVTQKLVYNLIELMETDKDYFDSSSRPKIFAIGDQVASLPEQPMIEITQFGVLPLPITDYLFKGISELYPVQAETNSVSIDRSKILIGDGTFEQYVSNLYNNTVSSKVGCLKFIRHACVFNKLVIEGPHEGAQTIKQHQDDDHISIPDIRDREHISSDMYKYGTLCIQLPSTYTGGSLTIEHINKHNITLKPSANLKRCYFYALVGSVTTHQSPILSGYKVTLQYNLYAPGGIDSTLDSSVVNKLNVGKCLNYLLKKDIPVFWPLRKPCKSIENGSVKFSQSDRSIADSLLEAASYVNGTQIEIYVASLNKRFREPGMCIDIGTEQRKKIGFSPIPREKCFVSSGDPKTVFYDITDFKPLNNIPQPKDLSIFLEIDDVLKYSHINQWGPVEDVACSGRSSSRTCETFETCMRKDIFVVWSQSNGFAYNLSKSLDCGIEYLEHLDIASGDETSIRDMEKAIIAKLKNKVARSSCVIKYRMLKLCMKNKSWESCLDLLRIFGRKNNCGIPIRDDMSYAYRTIARLVSVFGWEKSKTAVMRLFDKCDAYQCKEIIKCSDLIPQIDKEAVLILLVNKIADEDSDEQNFEWFFKIIFYYGLSLPTFPEKAWKKLTECWYFTSFHNLETCLENYCQGEMADKVIELYINEMEQDPSGWADSTYDGIPVLTYCINHKKDEYINKFAEFATSCPPTNGDNCKLVAYLIEVFVTTKHSGPHDMPSSLMQVLKGRHKFLNEFVNKGSPQFTWAQPEAIIHSDMYGLQNFLNGTTECYTINFSTLEVAVDFVNKYKNPVLCLASYTMSRNGRLVTITKDKAVWKREVKEYECYVKEYENVNDFIETEMSYEDDDSDSDSNE